jgi:DNA invertase Pin-like site-specific DNA recombinase
MAKIRYAILKAVSTEAQAGRDKVSLEVQEARGREVARARGWVESSGPYTIPGESRTKYVNLAHAEAAMPDLKRMLDDAHTRAFDVLVMYDYDRLRDLLGMVSKTLSHYRVQMFAVNMPVEPVSPDQYNPYKTDMAAMMETLAMLKQKTQTNDLRRKYQEAMPRRASARGLPVKVPFGYKKPVNSKTPPEQDGALLEHVLRIKDMFLSGRSTGDCADYMNATGVPPKGKKWYPQTIKEILLNPFYAGVVRWGVTRSELDPRLGQTRRTRKHDPDTIAVGVGKHIPIWDNSTHDAIVAEFRRRGRAYRGKSNQTLSGLLECGLCGLRMWTFYNSSGPISPARMVWRCSSREEHVTMHNSQVLERLAEIILRDVDHALARPDEYVAGEHAAADQAHLAELKERRTRLVNAYTVGALNMVEMAEMKAPIDDEVSAVEMRVREHLRAERANKDRIAMLETLKAHRNDLLPYLKGSPADVNYALRKAIKSIIIHESGELTINWS